jgi:tetratricopeptide (TPR) repeat protein
MKSFKIQNTTLKRSAVVFEDSEVETDSFEVKRVKSTTNRSQLIKDGIEFAEKEQFAEALDAFAKALQASSTEEEFIQGDAKIHDMRSQVYIEMEKPWPAVQAAEKSVILDPSSPFAHQTLGRALQAFGDYELAVKAFEKSIELKEISEVVQHDLPLAREQLVKKQLAQEEQIRVTEIARDTPPDYTSPGILPGTLKARISEVE